MEAEIPRREPRILPLVRHGEHLIAVQVLPVMVASLLTLVRRRWLPGVALQPIENVVVIALPVPQHSRERLTLHPSCVLAFEAGVNVIVKLIRFLNPFGHDRARSQPRGRP